MQQTIARVAGVVCLLLVVSVGAEARDPNAPVVGTVTHSKSNGAALSLTFSHTTMGGFSPGLIVAAVVRARNSGYDITATYGGTQMQRVWLGQGSNDGEWQFAWFHAVAPPVGTANVVITLDRQNAYGISAMAIDVTNYGGLRAAIRSTETQTTSLSPWITIPSAANDVVLDIVASDATNQVFTPANGQLSLGAQSGQANVDPKSALSWKPGAPSVTMSWALTMSDKWGVTAVSVMPLAKTPDGAPPDLGPVSFQGVFPLQTDRLRWPHQIRAVDTCLVVLVHKYSVGVDIASVTYGGVPLTRHPNHDARTLAFVLVDPPPGVAELVVTQTSIRWFSVGAYSLRSDGIRAFARSLHVAADLTVESVDGDLVVGQTGSNVFTQQFEAGAGQTELFHAAGGTLTIPFTSSYERAAGPSTTMSWTYTPLDWSYKGLVSMIPESTPLPQPPQLRLFLDADFPRNFIKWT